jgi:hypothetical protein
VPPPSRKGENILLLIAAMPKGHFPERHFLTGDKP